MRCEMWVQRSKTFVLCRKTMEKQHVECKNAFCVNGPRGSVKEFLPNETSHTHFSEFLFLSWGQEGGEGSSGTVPCLTSQFHTRACIRYFRTQNAERSSYTSGRTQQHSWGLNLTPALSDLRKRSVSSLFTAWLWWFSGVMLWANICDSQLYNWLSSDLSSVVVPVRSVVFFIMSLHHVKANCTTVNWCFCCRFLRSHETRFNTLVLLTISTFLDRSHNA